MSLAFCSSENPVVSRGERQWIIFLWKIKHTTVVAFECSPSSSKNFRGLVWCRKIKKKNCDLFWLRRQALSLLLLFCLHKEFSNKYFDILVIVSDTKVAGTEIISQGSALLTSVKTVDVQIIYLFVIQIEG